MKKATSNDVAKLAGVSQSTVSLILNNSDKIYFKDETRERVFAAAKQLNYRIPHENKQKPKANASLLLLLTPTLSNPYYSELFNAVESYASGYGCKVIVCNTFRKPELEKYYLDIFLKEKIDGIIYTFLPSFPHMIEQLSKTVPTVLIGEKKGNVSISSIELSNLRAGSLLAEHLYHLGHRHFSFISTPLHNISFAREQRIEGMRNVLKQYGLDPNNLEVISPDEEVETENTHSSVPYEFQIGYKLTKELLKKPHKSTALIGVNDMTAIGIQAALHEEGIRIPKDYSVCGFDNIFPSTITTPPITTIDHHLKIRCKTAVDMLLSKINVEVNNALSLPMINEIKYAPQLIERNSTGPAPTSRSK